MRIILLACEGRHELAVLPQLAAALGWDLRTSVTTDDPEAIQRLVPQPPRLNGRDFSWRASPRPVFLQRSDDWMVVQRFDGDRRLRREAPLYAAQIGSELAAVGIVIDADDLGPERRAEQLRGAFARWVQAPLVAGTVIGGALRVGLWVSPDDVEPGNFDDLLEKAAEAGRSGLARGAPAAARVNARATATPRVAAPRSEWWLRSTAPSR